MKLFVTVALLLFGFVGLPILVIKIFAYVSDDGD